MKGRSKLFILSCLTLLICFGLIFMAHADLGGILKKAQKGVKDAAEGMQESSKGVTKKIDTDIIAKEAEKELRDAQNLMFNGKKEEAIVTLKSAAQKIANIKGADPKHKRLKALESKRDRLKKDLEKRTGKKIILPTTPAKPMPEKPEDIVKEARAELRGAEKNMHNGKPVDAKKQLDRAAQLLDHLKKKDPENKELTTLETKLKNQTRDVEKRLPKPEVSKAETSGPAPSKAQTSGPAPSKEPAKTGEKLPYHARQPMQKIERTFPRLESNIEDVKTGDKDMRRSYLKRIPDKIKEIEDLLATAKEKATLKGHTREIKGHRSLSGKISRL